MDWSLALPVGTSASLTVTVPLFRFFFFFFFCIALPRSWRSESGRLCQVPATKRTGRAWARQQRVLHLPAHQHWGFCHWYPPPFFFPVFVCFVSIHPWFRSLFWPSSYYPLSLDFPLILCEQMTTRPLLPRRPRPRRWPTGALPAPGLRLRTTTS